MRSNKILEAKPDEIVTAIKAYKKLGAKRFSDYIDMAKKDNKKDIVDYLTKVDKQDQKSIEDYLNSLDEVTITRGMARSMNKNAYRTCKKCGLSMLRYPGRYPQRCPDCGTPYVTPSKESVNKIEATTAGSVAGAPQGFVVRKCKKCGTELKGGGSKDVKYCPECGAGMESVCSDNINMLSELIDVFLSILNETEGVDIEYVGIMDDALYVMINGKKYGYKEIPGDIKLDTLADKFKKIMYHSAGKAIAWLKKHATLASGSKPIDTYEPKNEDEKVVKHRLMTEVDPVAPKVEPVSTPSVDNYDDIEKFWNGDDGKVMSDKIKNLPKEYSLKSKDAYGDAILSVNSLDLLDNMMDAREEKDGSASILMRKSVAAEKVNKLISDLKSKGYGNTKQVDSNDRARLIVVY